MSARPPEVRIVKKRLSEVIVGADDDEKRTLMQEIKRHKPFCADHDMDSSIALHLCRSLTDFAQQPDPPHMLMLNVIRTIVNVVPTCKMLNEPVCASADGKAVSLYDNIVPLIAAVLLRAPVSQFKHTEQLLLKFLLDRQMGRVLVAMDVWCILFRAAETVQVTQTEFLLQLALAFPANDFRRNNIHCLISRFMRFMDDECRQILVRKFDPCTNAFHFALKYLTKEEKEADLKRLLDQVFDSETCVLTHVQSVCHLLALVPEPDEPSVRKMKELVASFSDKATDPVTKQVVNECMRLLSSI